VPIALYFPSPAHLSFFYTPNCDRDILRMYVELLLGNKAKTWKTEQGSFSHTKPQLFSLRSGAAILSIYSVLATMFILSGTQVNKNRDGFQPYCEHIIYPYWSSPNKHEQHQWTQFPLTKFKASKLTQYLFSFRTPPRTSTMRGSVCSPQFKLPSQNRNSRSQASMT
jgi:hypothetical protein